MVPRDRSCLLVLFCLHTVIGSPSLDYPNDYYNDAEYYNDDYDSSNSSGENYIDVGETHVKETVVKRNPTFVSTKKTIIVNEGDTIKLPCQVDDLGDFVMIWKKGSNILALGATLTNPTDTRIKVVSTMNGYQLVISLADYEQDDGDYTCQVSAMRNLELVHTVKVRVQPEVEAVPASGKLVVRAGAPASLRCRVVRGSPAPELTWRRQSRPLPGGEEALTAEALTFPATTRHHSGLYTCAADNGWGAPAEAVVRLDVQHKPEIEQEETFIHTRDGDEVEITCTVHASPAAEVEWYRNGQLLQADRTVIQKRGNRHSLLLQNVGQQDRHGKYQCRARNALGEAMALTEVSGNAAPANFKSPAVGRELTAYTLEWVVTSTSPVTEFLVEWRSAGGQEWATLAAPVAKVGPESFSGAVSLEGLGHGAKYEARVTATNAYGPSSPSQVFQFSTLREHKADPSTSSSPQPLLGLPLLPLTLLALLLRC